MVFLRPGNCLLVPQEGEALTKGKLVCLLTCYVIISISISFYMSKNKITCRRKEEERNSMKLGFRSAALLFLHLVGFVSLSEGVLPRYIAAMMDGGQSCILWSLYNISTSKSRRTASVIIFATFVVPTRLVI